MSAPFRSTVLALACMLLGAVACAAEETNVAPAVAAPAVAPAPVPDDWTLYHVMMGMFRNGDRRNDGEIRGWRHPQYAGGDLRGVLEKVDYLADLGVDAVWLSPIFAARSSHGYDVTNYFAIGDAVGVPGDPAASLALFRELRDALHAKGIQLILDVPLNHASRSYDRRSGDPKDFGPRATGARQEAEKTWESWNAGYRYWDFDHAPTRRFLIDVALHWLVEEKVDGLRLDYVRGVPHDFWADLRAAVEAKKPGAFLVGECWADAEGPAVNAEAIATYFAPVDGRPQLPAMFDFPLQMAMTDAFARRESLAAVDGWLTKTETLWGPGAVPVRFLDNHDLARFAAWEDDPDRLVAAVAFMASLSSPLVLFYGTETGLTHGAPKPGFVDAGRVPMPWDRLDTALLGRFRNVLGARRAHAALRSGERRTLAVEKELLVMSKTAPSETALVAVNLAGSPRRIELDPAQVPGGGAGFTGVLGGSAPVLEEGRLVWTVPAETTAVAVRAASAPDGQDR